MAIIGISGYSGSGKDTIGMIIQYLNCSNVGNVSIEEAIKDYKEHEWWLEDQSEWEIRKFAGKLKDIAEHLTGIPIEKFEDQEFKKTNLGPEWDVPATSSLVDGIIDLSEMRPMTVREFLQKLGTNGLRNGLHDNVWVNALMADYDDNSNWIITDTRFPNEAKAIKDKGGIIIRIDRPGVSPINTHPSETGLDNWKFDYKIANLSDIFTLKETVRGILKHAKLL
jgi:hypothetical protein